MYSEFDGSGLRIDMSSLYFVNGLSIAGPHSRSSLIFLLSLPVCHVTAGDRCRILDVRALL